MMQLFVLVGWVCATFTVLTKLIAMLIALVITDETAEQRIASLVVIAMSLLGLCYLYSPAATLEVW
jgi:hypothetical protein